MSTFEAGDLAVEFCETVDFEVGNELPEPLATVLAIGDVVNPNPRSKVVEFERTVLPECADHASPELPPAPLELGLCRDVRSGDWSSDVCSSDLTRFDRDDRSESPI